MLRSGFLLGVGGPAAILTLLVLPTVRASADRLVQPLPAITVSAPVAPAHIPSVAPASLAISPIHSAPAHLATMPQAKGESPAALGPTASEKELLKPRRMTREGCEAPLSSLVGPEARRMVPGRCMA